MPMAYVLLNPIGAVIANPSAIFAIFAKFAKFAKIAERFAGAGNLIFEVLGDKPRRPRHHHPVDLDGNFIFTEAFFSIPLRSPATAAGVWSISRISHGFRTNFTNFVKIAGNK